MIKCKICGIKKENGRQMHGHMMKSHYDEYVANNCDMEKLTEGYTKRTREHQRKDYKEKKIVKKNIEKPDGFRLLNKYDKDEYEAFKEGYRFIDAELIAYTDEEARNEGWI